MEGTKVCNNCNQEYEPASNRQKYCTKKCSRTKYKLDNKEKLAKQGKEYREANKEKFQTYKKKKKDKATAYNRKYYVEHRVNKGLNPKICEHCGKKFIPKVWIQKYCNTNCRKIQYFLDNKEKISQRCKMYRDANKDVLKAYRKEYYVTNKQEILEKNKEYYVTNKQVILEKQKEYREANKEKVFKRRKKYREKNKEKIAVVQKMYYEANKKKLLAYQKDYRETHKEKIADWMKRYYEENKEQIVEYKKEYYQSNKERINEMYGRYIKRTYEECEGGLIKDTLYHKLFDFLNRNPYAELREVKVAFYEYNPDSVAAAYKIWVRLTYEKYVLFKK